MYFDSLNLHLQQEKTDTLSALGNLRYKQKYILTIDAICIDWRQSCTLIRYCWLYQNGGNSAYWAERDRMNCSFEFLSMREDTTMVIGCVIYALIHTLWIIQPAKPFNLSGNTFRLFSIQVRERKSLKNSEAQV